MAPLLMQCPGREEQSLSGSEEMIPPERTNTQETGEDSRKGSEDSLESQQLAR